MTAFFWQALVLIIIAVLIGMLIGYVVRKAMRAKPEAREPSKTTAYQLQTAATPTPGVAVGASTAALAADQEAVAEALAEETKEALVAEQANQDEKADQQAASISDETEERSEAVLKAAEAAKAALSSQEDVDEDSLMARVDASADVKLDEMSEGAEVDPDAEEARIAAALLTVPKDATSKQKADAVGKKPKALKKPRKGNSDDLKRIKGVGKVIEGKLNDLGIFHYDQIANWSRDEVAWVTTFLSFKGRIDREKWIPQAKGLLSADDAIAVGEPDAAQLNIDGILEPKEAAASKVGEDERIAAANAEAPGEKELDSTTPAAKPKSKKATASKATAKPKAEATSEEDEDAKIAAAIAALPKDASAEDKANVAGKKPRTMKQARKGGADDLKRIKGVGKVIETKLNDVGIYHFDQIAKWNRAHINWVSTLLSFKGRIDREDWIEQAKLLAAGEETEFSKRVDKGDVDSSK
ncbi:Predicted 5' DNA nuclease, flap endonuclease-1-like, helix-3-turn-helix (H3TH) domain [Cohaesibacter sp. ES.047]|uniref:hypothetical protein n=1 Tax=Cohaesibacter sp. ES.047 TaxID=1798205 RepID=UPI000BB969B9|nr:hypothetical protein [Cohaesibacter sp. ES.047]SNY92533.1 Predicted 5' DNA nuclease, flap endonuclease-1-like, helix-3-turn-helix (H3TH) domain [Cohaesibacter sp. ES.047]